MQLPSVIEDVSMYVNSVLKFINNFFVCLNGDFVVVSGILSHNIHNGIIVGI